MHYVKGFVNYDHIPHNASMCEKEKLARWIYEKKTKKPAKLC